MTTLTPKNIVDNLNKNFDKIIGEAIIGYNKFYQMEQILLNSIKTNSEQNSAGSKNILAFLTTYATSVQYGKNYFLDQIITNYIEMENLTLYINTISPFLSQSVNNEKGFVEEFVGGQKGGNNLLIKLFVSLVIQTLFSSLANSEHIAKSISLYGEDVDVSIDIDNGIIPKARSTIYGNLNPLNATQMEQKTREYGNNIEFPQDTIVNSLNITNIYSQEIIGKMKGNQGILEKFLNLKSDEQFYNLFYSNISARVEYINSLVDVVHPALEDMCKGFVETTDTILPVPLYELLNSKLAMEFQRIKDRRDMLVDEKMAELKSDKLLELQITDAEPGLYDRVSETSSQVTSGISNFFSWQNQVSKTVSETTADGVSKQPLSTQELQDIYTNVDNSVKKQIQELGNSFDKEAFATLANEKMAELQEDTINSLSVTNLKIYLTAVCKIKKPRYMFNQTSGILSIKNPSWSRFHLQILAQNVVSYYDTVIKGIPKVSNTGEVIVDIPDGIRIENLNSLLEKAQSIIPVLIEYDTGLVSSLAEGHESASNLNDFFENIAKMWIDIKNPILQASEQFPESSRRKNIELTRIEEEAVRNNMELTRKHDMAVVERVLQAKQKNDMNALTEKDWAIFNRMIGINVEGSLNTVTNTANSIVNSTTDFGTNTLENVNLLLKTGFSSINSIAWGIANSGMVLFLPVLMLLAFRTGLITAVFSNIKNRIEPVPNPNSIVSNSVVTNSVFNSNPNSVVPNSNSNAVVPKLNPNFNLNLNLNANSVPKLNSLPKPLPSPVPVNPDNYRNFLSQQEEGEEYEPNMVYRSRRGGKKTRKHNKKKKRTRKLKRGNRRQTKYRQTKYRKSRSTKKH
jgi:hypothetical protein